MGSACSHAPDVVCWLALRRALAWSSAAASSRVTAVRWQHGSSHARWRIAHRGPGGAVDGSTADCHACIAVVMNASMFRLCRCLGRSVLTRSAVLAADAKKAEDASETALRTPKPPHLTGSEACSQPSSVKSMLIVVVSVDLSRASYLTSSRLPVHGAVRRV